MASERVELVRRTLAAGRQAWVAGEPAPDAAWEGFAEDVQYDPVPNYPEVRHITGVAGLRAWIDDFAASWGGIDLEPTTFEEHGDVVIARVMLRAAGTETRPPAKGRAFCVFTFRGDEIVRRQDFLSAAEARRAAGVAD